MPDHPIYLAKYRLSSTQRAYFAIFIPNLADATKDPDDRSASCKGTLINVVGAPMAGYVHEIKRGHCWNESNDLEKLDQIGNIQTNKPLSRDFRDDDTIAKAFETVALQLRAPGRSENFMAPVNDVNTSEMTTIVMVLLSLKLTDNEPTLSRVDDGLREIAS